MRTYLAHEPIANRFFGDPDEKEIEMHLQKALNAASKAKANEVEELIRDHSPELTAMLRHLKWLCRKLDFKGV